MTHQKINILCIIGGVITLIFISSILLLFMSCGTLHLEVVSQLGSSELCNC